MSIEVAQMDVNGRLGVAIKRLELARFALIEARAALDTLDAPSGKDSGLATIRHGRPIKNIIDEALAEISQ